jgi:hypothetical protein
MIDLTLINDSPAKPQAAKRANAQSHVVPLNGVGEPITARDSRSSTETRECGRGITLAVLDKDEEFNSTYHDFDVSLDSSFCLPSPAKREWNAGNLLTSSAPQKAVSPMPRQKKNVSFAPLVDEFEEDEDEAEDTADRRAEERTRRLSAKTWKWDEVTVRPIAGKLFAKLGQSFWKASYNDADDQCAERNTISPPRRAATAEIPVSRSCELKASTGNATRLPITCLSLIDFTLAAVPRLKLKTTARPLKQPSDDTRTRVGVDNTSPTREIECVSTSVTWAVVIDLVMVVACTDASRA